MIGSTLYHYIIQSDLGKGGMGEVYLARDTRLNRLVAIKLLAASAAGDPESVRRFIKEAKAASSLNHPNIVTIHEINQDGALQFIVMEYIDGAALSSATGSPMQLQQFLDQAVQITSALGAAHEAGIVHRDIKPANIMVSLSGRIKVVDFGLARLSLPFTSDGSDLPTAEWESRITKPGTILGTLGYMSPEQVQGQSVDMRSDVFSLGVLFYEMLSGERPFKAASPLATIASILRDDPPSIESRRKDIPPALAKLVKRCLAKNADNRYPTAAEIHDELVAIRDSLRPAGTRPRSPLIFAMPAVAVLLLGAAAAFWWRHESQQAWVRNVALPEIERLAAADSIYDAFLLARRAREIAPDDPQLRQAWTNISFDAVIGSEPPDAEVSIRGYRRSESVWTPLGRTPMTASLPLSLVRFRVTRDGYVPLEVAPELEGESVTFRLHRPDQAPEGMVEVPAGNVRFEGTSADLPDFWIDRNEVTNRDFKRFIDGGGYRRRELWKHPILRDGRPLPWDVAMKELVDVTGRPGPAQWELGTYPEGQDDHPVEGVSWYEAAAYAEFAGKSLPTVYHWFRATGVAGVSSDILTMSNFSGKGTAPVGSLDGLGSYGTYDMAGNVKEWCLNALGERRFILGGSSADARYQFRQPDARPPIERLRGFGLRLIRQEEPPSAESLQAVSIVTPKLDSPVDDETFRTYAGLYDYDDSPLNATTGEVDDSHRAWRREIVSIDAAYGGERLPVNLFIPKNATPPYQTVVFFPGSDAVYLSSSRQLWLQWVDFYVRSGRAVAYPVYKGTYERRVPTPSGPMANRDLRIQRIKDVRRTIDYLTTRDDIDSDRLAYYGLSLGANYAPLVLAVEPRFKTSVLLAGGLRRLDVPPETQALNFVPRVTLPVLLVTGRNDFMSPYETSQRPLFEMLGTPPENKRHVLLDGGHIPSQYNEAVREILIWTDRWLGPVQNR